MYILIAGCGDVGNILASTLLQDGHTVYGLKRDTSTLTEGVTPIQADLTDTATLADLPGDIDRLIYMPTPASQDQNAYEAVFIEGWKNLWASLIRAPVRTLLVSSTSVFGLSDGSVVTEATPPEPARFNGRLLLQMEQLATGCADNLVVVRFSGIYGPERTRLITMAASPGCEVQQVPPYFTNRIHIDDAAAVLRHLLLLKQPEALYLASDDLPEPRYEVLHWLAQAQGVAVPTGLVLERAGQGKRVDNQKLRHSGFQLSFPNYQAGYGAILKLQSQDGVSK